MKKKWFREGLTWNTLIFDFEKKKVSVWYFQISTKYCTILPQYNGKCDGYHVPVISWLFFRWGKVSAGRLKVDDNGKFKDGRTGEKYRILLRRDFYLSLVKG